MPTNRKDPSKLRRRNARAGLELIPEGGCRLPVPELKDRPPTERTEKSDLGDVLVRVDRPFCLDLRDEWNDLWRAPMAVVWHKVLRVSLMDMRIWAGYRQDLYDDKFESVTAYAKASTEVRQLGDRYGHNPRARNNLGWELVDDDTYFEVTGDPLYAPDGATSRGTDDQPVAATGTDNVVPFTDPRQQRPRSG